MSYPIIDLDFLVCNQETIEPYDDQFRRICNSFLIQIHFQEANNADERWTFSLQLLQKIKDCYPWNRMGEISWLYDLYQSVFPVLERNTQYIIPQENSDNINLRPEILADYIKLNYSDIEQEWLWVIEESIRIDREIVAICSHEQKVNTVSVNNGDSHVVNLPILHNRDEWIDFIRNQNPWLRNELPQNGNYPYVPTNHQSDFPKQYHSPRRQSGFLDNRGRIWIKHIERGQTHWDVQCIPFRRDNYFKVTPEGRLLGKKPC